jgi:hypothetical protein
LPLFAETDGSSKLSTSTFVDSDSLEVSEIDHATAASETLLLAGVRGSISNSASNPKASHPNLVALISAGSSEQQFAHRALYWGRTRQFNFSAALGYGYELAGHYETGAS